MAKRPTRKKSTIPLADRISNKLDEAAFFLQHLKRHRDQQNQPQKPPAAEFRYHLSGFLSAAYSVGNLIARKNKKWLKQLSTADQDLHEQVIDRMRGDIVHEGHVDTTISTRQVEADLDPTIYAQGTQSMFGTPKTDAVTHSVDLNGSPREVVELCEQYLDLLRRESR